MESQRFSLHSMLLSLVASVSFTGISAYTDDRLINCARSTYTLTHHQTRIGLSILDEFASPSVCRLYCKQAAKGYYDSIRERKEICLGRIIASHWDVALHNLTSRFLGHKASFDYLRSGTIEQFIQEFENDDRSNSNPWHDGCLCNMDITLLRRYDYDDQRLGGKVKNWHRLSLEVYRILEEACPSTLVKARFELQGWYAQFVNDQRPIPCYELQPTDFLPSAIEWYIVYPFSTEALMENFVHIGAALSSVNAASSLYLLWTMLEAKPRPNLHFAPFH